MTIVNMTNDLEAKDDEITKLKMMLLNLKGKGDEVGTNTSSDISYDSKDAEKGDPMAFNPVFETDITKAPNIPLPQDDDTNRLDNPGQAKGSKGSSVEREDTPDDHIDKIDDPGQAKSLKRSSLVAEDPNLLQRPRISSRTRSGTKPSSSEEALVL